MVGGGDSTPNWITQTKRLCEERDGEKSGENSRRRVRGMRRRVGRMRRDGEKSGDNEEI